MISNESINIWSHLGGFLYFLVLLVYDDFFKIPNILDSSVADYLVFTALLIGFQVMHRFSIEFI